MIEENKVTVLIPSGAGAPGFAGICRCLRAESSWFIVAGDTNEHAYGKALCDEFFVVASSENEQSYLDAVMLACENYSVDVILPITTRELGILSENKKRFEAIGVKVVVSSADSILKANDKGKAAQIASELRLPVPDFAICNDLDSFVQAVKTLQVEHETVCFKPVRGNGSRGFGVIVHDIERGNFLGTKAGILPLTLSEWTLRMPKQFDIPLMVCAYLSGIEYSVDMLCSSGKTLFCVPRTRDKMIGGISVAGKLDRNFGLIAFCIQLAQAMELDGPIGMQWREDSEGVPHLIEINPRLQGTTSVLALAGINFPVQAVRLALGMELTSNTADIDWGSRFVRFWDERMLS
jgi:carbamoyl-phosphate synthase large subunit